MADIDAKVIAARRKAADEFFDALWAREDLKLSEKAVATRLLRHLNFKTGQCNPSAETIMKGAALSHTSVVDGLKVLRHVGFVTAIKGKGVTSNQYYFVALQTESWSNGAAWRAKIRPTSSSVQQAGIRPTEGSRQAEFRPASRPNSDQAEFRSPVGRNPAPNTVRNPSPSQVEESWEVSSNSREPVREDWR